MPDDRQRPSRIDEPLNGVRVQAAATELADLLHNLRAFDPANPGSAEDIGQLLQSIEQADGIARGIDSRLDTLLEDLEGMIGALEAERMGGKEPDVVEQERIREQEEAVEERLAEDGVTLPPESQPSVETKE